MGSQINQTHMQKQQKFLVAVLIVATVAILTLNSKVDNTESIKIGVISDFTGPAAYWGESSKVGVNVAVKELKAEGYNVDVTFEDYKLDAPRAATAAQKLSNIDKVSAIYSEFNPGAIAANSVLKDTDVFHMYLAAITSPLKDNPNAYKTYLDYEAGCKLIAQEFKNSGVAKIGVLKANQEFGELCLDGVREIYGDKIVLDSYNLGDTNFKTQLLKINAEKVEAVINVGFEGDTFNTLKVMNELGYSLRLGTVEDTMSDKVKTTFPNQIKNALTFGFQEVNKEFVKKVTAENGGKSLASNYAAAEAYTHIKQIVKALDACDEGDMECTKKHIDMSAPDTTFGFKKFNGRIADIGMQIYKY